MSKDNINYNNERARLEKIASGLHGFLNRMEHWINAFNKQEEALRLEIGKAGNAGIIIKIEWDMNEVGQIKQRCIQKNCLSYDSFDPTGHKRLPRFGQLAIDNPACPNRWQFFTGLIMSRNPIMNPAFIARLMPTEIELSSNDHMPRPTLFLLPDMLHFSHQWTLLEGSKQDAYSAACLQAFPTAPKLNYMEVAVGLIKVLLLANP